MEVMHPDLQEMTVSSGPLLDMKEQVKQAVDIVELVGSYVQLRRQGRHYVGLCPWHDDRRPSLQVNPERQSFKCWVCDIGGDVFTFVMQMESVGFPEALAMLADRAGISLERPSARSRAGASAKPTADKRTLYQATAWAERQYHDCLLQQPEAEPARRYLRERGITSESIKTFHLGFSPEAANWLVAKTEGRPRRAEILEAVGILARREDGSRYDRFRGRVLFSIRDPQGRPVGIGGRILPESGVSSPAKYVNSPETPLFSKSRLLYGLDVAKEAMRKSRTAIVVEGYTDCIVAHQCGFANTVAVLGTALGERHVQLLQRFADRIILVLDGDEAGQRRANEVLDLFVARQVDLRILTLPEGADPCDFLLARGPQAFAELLETKAVDALEHAFQTATKGVDLEGDVHGASQALETVVSIVARAPRPSGEARFREEKILQRLAKAFRIPEEQIRRRLTQLRRPSQRPTSRHEPSQEPPAEPIRLAQLEKADPYQCALLEILIQYPELLSAAREEFTLENLTLAPCRAIFAASCRLADAGVEPTFDRLMLEFDDTPMKGLLVELDDAPRVKEISNPLGLLEELTENFRRRESCRRHPGDVVTLRDTGLDESQKKERLNAMLRELRARQGISDPTDG